MKCDVDVNRSWDKMVEIIRWNAKGIALYTLRRKCLSFISKRRRRVSFACTSHALRFIQFFSQFFDYNNEDDDDDGPSRWTGLIFARFQAIISKKERKKIKVNWGKDHHDLDDCMRLKEKLDCLLLKSREESQVCPSFFLFLYFLSVPHSFCSLDWDGDHEEGELLAFCTVSSQLLH